MDKIILNKDLDKPLYVQLYDKIRSVIEDDRLSDDKLPSIRKLSKNLGVNNVTVINAYKLLEQEGYVYSIEGSGTYIKRLVSDEIPYEEDGNMELMLSGILPISKRSINFASVSPTPDLFPIEEFKEALVEVLDRDRGLAFLYPEINGYGPLRESISKFLLENYNTRVNVDQILITSGGQQGLDLIAKTMINQGDVVFVENPTYSAAFTAFKSRGAKIIGIPMMKDGMDLDVLKNLLKRQKPKFIYIMTNYQSPTTFSYSEEKKKELLQLAMEYDFYIIEDDFLTDLYFDDHIKSPLISLDKLDKIVFIKSFSKVFMPGVRIGFVTLPNRLLKGIIKAKHSTDISSSSYLQRAFDLYLRKGFWRNHIAKIRKVYSEKYNIMISELERLKRFDIEYTRPNGGLSLWLKLPENVDGIEFYKQCMENNLSLVPGKVFFIDNSLYNNYIRLSYGSVDNEEIIEGIKIIENILSKPFEGEDNEYMPFI